MDKQDLHHDWLTVPECTAIARFYNGDQLYAALKSGELRGVRRGHPRGTWLIRREDFFAWLERYPAGTR